MKTVALASAGAGTGLAIAGLALPRILPQSFMTGPGAAWKFGLILLGLGGGGWYLLRKVSEPAALGLGGMLGATGVYYVYQGVTAKPAASSGTGAQIGASTGSGTGRVLLEEMNGVHYDMRGVVYPDMGAVEALLQSPEYGRRESIASALGAR